MGLKERMKAASLVAKYKAILFKDIPKAKGRLTKWRNLIAEANDKKDKGAASRANDVLRAAVDYAEQLDKMAGLIKRVSLLTDNTAKIEQFIEKMGKSVRATNKAYQAYRYE